MYAITVTDAAGGTLVVRAGNRDFVHLRNFDEDDTVYVRYDGSATALTTANGFPIPPGGILALDNDGSRNVFNKAIYAICATGASVELRVQGADTP
jgi:hypothetical protein